MATPRSVRMAERRELREAAGEDDLLAPKSGWYDKRRIAAYFDTSPRTIERWAARGMPHALIGGKLKFKPTDCEPWLEAQGLLIQKGDC